MALDPDFAAELARELQPADYIAVLKLFREDMLRLVGVIEKAAAANDAVGLRAAAHGLAGAAGSMGAARLEAACRIAMSRHEVIPDLGAAAAEIRELATAVLADIEHAIARAEAA